MTSRGLALATCALALALVPLAGAATKTPATGAVDVALALEYVPGEIIVAFSADVPAAERSRAHQALATGVRDRLLLPGRGVRAELVKLRAGVTVEQAIQAYERHPRVRYAEPNGVARITATTPNDPLFTSLWGLDNTAQTVGGIVGVADADVDATDAWDLTTGSAGVVVGIVDTGIAYDHPDLAPNIWANGGETGGGKETNGVDDDANGYVDDFRGWDWVPGAEATAGSGDNDPYDFDGHGSHVAGTIGARGNDGYGVAGLNWNAKLMPLRICGTDGCQQWRQAKAFAYAGANGADVVNASLGGTQPSTLVSDAIAGAPQTLFVFAAGNEGSDNDAFARYPCNYDRPNIVCVAATDQLDVLVSTPTYTWGSNYGATMVDLAAPGYNVNSTLPHFVSGVDEDFETAIAGRWITGGTNNTWARECFGSNCYLTDSPGASYQNNTNSWARTAAAVDLSQTRGCIVSYWLILDIPHNADTLWVERSTDAVSWTAIAGWWGSTGGNWQFFDHEVPALDGQSAAYLRIRLVSNAVTVGTGAFLDSVTLRCVRNTGAFDGTEFDLFGGTSMATPHVAGAAALLVAADPGATVAELRNALLAGVDVIPALAGQVVTGGRLNVKKSLDLIAPVPPVNCLGLPATIVGSAGGDSLVGTAGADVIVGLGGDDTIAGAGGDDRVCAGDGDDVVSGGAGSDQLDGEGGVDTLDFSASATGVSASLATGSSTGEGADTASGFENVTGSAQADTLVGSAGANVLAGGDGDDTVRGLEGNDALTGGVGVDTVTYSSVPGPVTVNLTAGVATGDGSDSLAGFEKIGGSPGNDILIGDAAANTFIAGNGNDIIRGNAGDDNLQGQGGFDTADHSFLALAVSVDLAAGTATGQGSDSLTSIESTLGSNLADTILGNGVANTLNGAGGNDSIDGADGNDTLKGGLGNDSLDGGLGSDIFDLQAATGAMTVDLLAGTATGQGSDTLLNLEHVYGSPFADVLTGSNFRNVFRGFGGDDDFFGNAGNDDLYGGDGNDDFNGGSGYDKCQQDTGAGTTTACEA